MTFREQKRQARQQLHSAMAEPVLYIPFKGATPQAVTGRVHLNFEALGELRRAGFAELSDLTPQAIFQQADLAPVRTAVFVTEDMGAFQIEQVDPPNDITVLVRISRLPAAQYVAWSLTQGQPWCGLPAPTI